MNEQTLYRPTPPRVPLTLVVQRDDMPSRDWHSVNVSEGGCFVTGGRLLQLGEELRIGLRLDGEVIVTQARIAWVNSDRPRPCRQLPTGMGVEFVDLDARGLARLRTRLQLAGAPPYTPPIENEQPPVETWSEPTPTSPTDARPIWLVASLAALIVLVAVVALALRGSALLMHLPDLGQAQAPAVTSPPEADANAQLEQIQQLLRQRDYAAALQLCEALAKSAPSPTVQWYLGQAYMGLKRKIPACEAFRRYLETLPRDADRSRIDALLADCPRD